jgi:hypothetical protein
MLWLLVSASALGLLLGLWLRVAALLGASVALAVTTAVLMALGHWSLLQAIGFIFILLSTLQVSYLVGGLLLSGVWTRLRNSRGNRLVRRLLISP